MLCDICEEAVHIVCCVAEGLRLICKKCSNMYSSRDATYKCKNLDCEERL
ncbi:MAG: hypothetical protein Harvfovirus45_14, partial [Harvfovirus sp.]